MACVFPCIFLRVSTRSEAALLLLSLFRREVVEECGAIPDIEDKEGEVRLSAAVLECCYFWTADGFLTRRGVWMS